MSIYVKEKKCWKTTVYTRIAFSVKQLANRNQGVSFRNLQEEEHTYEHRHPAMFRPFEENRTPSYIIQDDFEDLPFEVFQKNIEIPELTIKLNFELNNRNQKFKLYIIPDKLKRRASLDKKLKKRDKIGTIEIELEDAQTDEEFDEFDESEQVYFTPNPNKSICKYKYMYGLNDFRDIKISKLTDKSFNDGKIHLLIEIPDFKNYLMYNLITKKLLNEFNPETVNLFIEGDDENVVDSSTIKKKLLNGTYKSPIGEPGMTGITASFINKLKSLDSIDFIVVPRDMDVLSTLYI